MAESKEVLTRRHRHIKALRDNVLPPSTASIMAAYKEPLRAVEGGFGYYGTIAYDTETQQYTQCHACGYFFKNLGSHVRSHDISRDEYKEKYGLAFTVPLTAPKHRTPAHIRWHELSDEKKQERIKRLRDGFNRHVVENGEPRRNLGKGKSLYKKNIQGDCPDQLLDKILTLSHKMGGKTPTQREFRNEYGRTMDSAFKLTYGGWGSALDIVGLRRRRGEGGLMQRAYTQEELVEILRNFRDENGREASTLDLRRGLMPDYNTFKRHFHTWNNALEHAYGGK